MKTLSVTPSSLVERYQPFGRGKGETWCLDHKYRRVVYTEDEGSRIIEMSLTFCIQQETLILRVSLLIVETVSLTLRKKIKWKMNKF